MPTLGSLFDGIGGFPLAAVRNGIEPVWASEIEAFPIEVTRKRFPSMLHVGDITKLNGAELPPVDIITGGSPCQDLSVAGARAGLAGERSGLFMEQIRVVKEMRDADERRGRTAHTVRPRYMCWENVPGSFSSAGGEDFRIVLEEIVRIKDGSCSVPRPDSGRWESAGAIILGNQFSLAWRVMDAQFWGVAQRRKRIFLVADFAGRSAPQILFEQNRLPGYSASSGGQRQGTAASAPGCSDPPGGTGPIGFFVGKLMEAKSAGEEKTQLVAKTQVLAANIEQTKLHHASEVQSMKSQMENERLYAAKLRTESDQQWAQKLESLKQEMQRMTIEQQKVAAEQLAAKQSALQENNRLQMDELLKPIKEQFADFKKSVEEKQGHFLLSPIATYCHTRAKNGGFSAKKQRNTYCFRRKTLKK